MRGYAVQVRQHETAPWEIMAYFQLKHDAVHYELKVNSGDSECEARILPGTFSQDMTGTATIHILH